MSKLGTVKDHAEQHLDEAVALRRAIHAQPELGLHLPNTQRAILDDLSGLELEIHAGEALSSITAILDSGRPGPTVLLRADMDALPMSEDTDEDFASMIPGAAHSCGHDIHVAMLAGAAKVLCERRSDIDGRVIFMFQPGEEGHFGARHMVDDGLLTKYGPVDLAFAIHQTPSLPSGVIATREGTLMASADEFEITVHGRGGHASTPYLCLDPTPIACEIVLAIQTMVTRRLNAFDPAVVTVGRFTAGTTHNVIPETASILGTIRSVSTLTRGLVHEELRRVVDGVALAHGATAACEISEGYGVTSNEPTAANWVLDLARQVLGQTRAVEMPTPVMGAEDFSEILDRVPGAMALLGTCPEGVDFSSAAPCHSNRMVANESAMAAGIAMYAAVVLSGAPAVN